MSDDLHSYSRFYSWWAHRVSQSEERNVPDFLYNISTQKKTKKLTTWPINTNEAFKSALSLWESVKDVAKKTVARKCLDSSSTQTITFPQVIAFYVRETESQLVNNAMMEPMSSIIAFDILEQRMSSMQGNGEASPNLKPFRGNVNEQCHENVILLFLSAWRPF